MNRTAQKRGTVKMTNEMKISQRDETLIKVLDRLSDNIQKQESFLEDITKRQLESSVELERTGQWQHARHDDTEASLEKTRETLLRYRSDMLKLVNEQDRLNDLVIDLNKKNATIAYVQESITNSLADISSRLDTQEKSIREISTYSVQQGEALSRKISEMNRDTAKLHTDTEKRIGDAYRDFQRQLADIRRDTMRRLLALDKVESSLEILLIRTEPPEKKPFFVIRAIRKPYGALKRIWLQRKMEQ